MSKNPSRLTGTAGEHYVAYKLSSLGAIVAIPREGTPTIDILASNLDCTKMIGIQVKTTDWATRERGRGANRKPHHLEFPLGKKSLKKFGKNLYYAFVDLNGLDWHEKQPDVYIVPSKFVHDHCVDWIDDVTMVRFHIEIEKMNRFKNNWDSIMNKLL